MYIQLNQTGLGDPTTVAPVLSLDSVTVDGLGTIPLKLTGSGQFEGFFRMPPTSHNADVRLSGRLQIDSSGTRRSYDAKKDAARWSPVAASARVRVGGPISSSSTGFARVGADGTFTTRTTIGYEPYLLRSLVIQVIVETKDGKRIGATAVVELIDLTGFLGIVDAREKSRPSGQTHLEFVASVRKIYHGGDREPQFIGPFNFVLYRHRHVAPILKFKTPEEERLHRYKVLYHGGELIEIGHVLCGIEGAPKQQPNKDQDVPRPLRPDLIVTWAGDLGSALQYFIAHFWLATDKTGKWIDNPDELPLEYYLKRDATRSDLLGDIDGINVGSAYDASRSLAENLSAYYAKKSGRRFHEFIANSKDEKGVPELPLLPGAKPPKLSTLARQNIARYTKLYLTYFWLRGKLYDGPEEVRQKRVDAMIQPGSPEMDKVVDHFVRFLEDGLTLEYRRGVRP